MRWCDGVRIDDDDDDDDDDGIGWLIENDSTTLLLLLGLLQSTNTADKAAMENFAMLLSVCSFGLDCFSTTGTMCSVVYRSINQLSFIAKN